MEVKTKSPLLLYTEQTPNPQTLKFVTNKMLYNGTADFKEETIAKSWSAIASQLFTIPYVKSVYINNNYITITKESNYEWSDIMLELKQQIKHLVESGTEIVKEGYKQAVAAQLRETHRIEYSAADKELVEKIKELIDTYVKPAVEADGGNIEFRSYREGIVTVLLQGSCSGCPSATITLKNGIEGMLKRMVPEVKEVIADMG